jgi:pimeloyl-ACP methyl ester carboxylesterase
LKSLPIVGAAAGLGTLALSRVLVDHDVALASAINAERLTFDSARAGRLSYYVDDNAEGRPLVLIHSINAAPSSHEMRPLFDHYRSTRPVYSLDLPGFGFSDRSERRYAPDLYVAAISDFLRDIVGEAADVVALSLGSEFAASVARDQPELVSSLTLISPSGMRDYSAQPPQNVLYKTFSFPLWSQSFYDLLTSQRSIRYYLGMSFVGEPSQAFLDYAYDTSHQPGARRAPLYFISGQLFNYSAVESIYMQVDVPTLVIFDKDPNVSFDKLPDILSAKPNWQSARVAPSLGLPHWEQLEQTTAALDDFWSGVG